jgi:membrane protease YdiL (CAAX protease family)
MLKNNSNKNFQKTNSKNLAWVYLIIFAPLQTILVLAGNNSNFFGERYILVDLILRFSLVILPIIWFFVIDKKKFKPKFPTLEEIKVSSLIGGIFMAIILFSYYAILKPNFTFDTVIYNNFPKELFIFFGLIISFLNAFSEEFNYRYMIFNKLKDLNLNGLKASLMYWIYF